MSDGLDLDELTDRYPSVDEIAGQGAADAPESSAAPSFMGCRRWFWDTRVAGPADDAATNHGAS